MARDSTAAQTDIPAVPRIPAYRRIEEDIRAKVRDGRLPAGTMLTGRHNLAREYGVALSTAQQAVANLIAEGVLETSDRRGTFVSHPNGGGMTSDPAPGVRLDADSASPPRQTSATLGIVATARIEMTASPDVGSLWAQLAIRSLEHVFSAAGGATRFFDRYPDERGPYPRGLDEANAYSLSQAIAALRADGADAIAVVGLCDAPDMSEEVVRAIDVEHTPTVYLSWHEVQPPLSQVFYDNRFAGYQAARHLLRQGYRRLVFLVPFSDTWLTERIQGAHDAVRHAALPAETLRLYPAEPLPAAYDRRVSPTNVRKLAQTAFATGWDLGAGTAERYGIITPNDEIAYTLLDAAAERGLAPGRDFGLIGFDDDPRACVMELTTVRPPVEAMGEEAGRLLLRTLRGDKNGQQVRLRSHVIARASTLPHRGQGAEISS